MGKLKKSKASPAATAAAMAAATATATATPAPLHDEAVLDDLFAQLDVQERETNKPPSRRKAPSSGASPSTSSADKKITMNGAMSSAKARFRAREVSPI